MSLTRTSQVLKTVAPRRGEHGYEIADHSMSIVAFQSSYQEATRGDRAPMLLRAGRPQEERGTANLLRRSPAGAEEIDEVWACPGLVDS